MRAPTVMSSRWGFKQTRAAIVKALGQAGNAVVGPIGTGSVWLQIPGNVGAAGEAGVGGHRFASLENSEPAPLGTGPGGVGRAHRPAPGTYEGETAKQFGRLAGFVDQFVHQVTPGDRLDIAELEMNRRFIDLRDKVFDLEKTIDRGGPIIDQQGRILQPADAGKRVIDAATRIDNLGRLVFDYAGPQGITRAVVEAVILTQLRQIRSRSPVNSGQLGEVFKNLVGWEIEVDGCEGQEEEYWKQGVAGALCHNPGPGPGWNIGSPTDDDLTGIDRMSSWQAVAGRPLGSPFGWAVLTRGYFRPTDGSLENIHPVTQALPRMRTPSRTTTAARIGGGGRPPAVSGLTGRPVKRGPRKSLVGKQHKPNRWASTVSGLGREIGFNALTEVRDVVDVLWKNIPKKHRKYYGKPTFARKVWDIWNAGEHIQWGEWTDSKGKKHGGALWDAGVNAIQDAVYGALGQATARGARRSGLTLDTGGRAVRRAGSFSRDLGGSDPVSGFINTLSGY